MKKITLTILLCLGLCAPVWAQQQLNFTAPIPSPVFNGVFFWLDDSGELVEGSCSRPGTIARTGNELIFCDSDLIWKYLKGVWQQNGDNVTLADQTPANTQVGIGINSTFDPDYKLHVDGGIVGFTGTYASGDDVGTPGAGTRFLFVPKLAALRSGQVTGTQWDDPNIGPHSTGLGLDNRVSGARSSVLGGQGNTITAGQYDSVIVSGSNSTMNDTNVGFLGNNFMGACDTCTLDGIGHFIGSGSGHDINSSGWNTIVGGQDNNVAGISGWNFIGGGSNHDHAGLGANATVGGLNNDITGQHSFIGSGDNNTITSGLSTFMGGGHQNTLSGGYNVLVGGDNNINQGLWNFVGGGVQNFIQGAGSGVGNVIVGGQFNRANGNAGMSPGRATVVGGEYNQAVDNHAFVGGGGGDIAAKGNIASGAASAVVGGENNDATATYAAIVGGQNNTASGVHSSIGGGQSNTANVAHTAIGGGQSNTASGTHSAIPGGLSNTASGLYSLAFGNATQATNSYAIALGETNVASGANSVALGRNMTTSGDRSFIFGDHAVGFANATADTALFYIAGNLGIGQANGAEAPDKKLEVDGEAEFHGDIWVKGTHYPSDKTLKTNIAPIQNSLDKIDNLNGVNFEWTQDSGLVEKGKDIGVISQDVERVFPEAVSTNNGIKTVDYSRLVAPLIEAVKELNEKTTNLNKEVSELKTENKQLKNRIRELERL